MKNLTIAAIPLLVLGCAHARSADNNGATAAVPATTSSSEVAVPVAREPAPQWQDKSAARTTSTDSERAAARDVHGNPAATGQNPDNSGVNKRDSQSSEVTAGDQSNSGSDIHITQQIRRAVVSDSSLSTYAHNVKVITQDGKVTLKGPVRSEEEKRTVESRASEIAGANHVKSELEVAPK